MTIAVKIFNSILMLCAVFMGLKQGYAMFTAKAEMLEMFSKWNFSKTAVIINGAVTIISALLILNPKDVCLGEFFNGGRNFNDYLLSSFRQRL